MDGSLDNSASVAGADRRHNELYATVGPVTTDMGSAQEFFAPAPLTFLGILIRIIVE